MFKSIQVQIEPLGDWPGKPTADRRRSQFKAGLDSTYRLLENELAHLGAKRVVIQAECSRSMIRQDGLLRTDARMDGPGVIVSFDSKNGPLSYPCDTYSHFGCNLRAIALALQALRAVDRYGVSGRGEQYRGWQALPAPNGDTWTSNEATEFLKRIVPGTLEHNGIEAALLRAERMTHPDRGGNADDFKKVQRARKVLLTK